MSRILKQLGIDPDDVKWYHLAACMNMPINWFYDEYENDSVIAEQADQVCLSCPVIKQCYQEGVKIKEFGVRGGIYMNLGRVDKQYNAHKSEETWDKLKKIHGKNIL